MMKKKLSKTLWYGTDIDSFGSPIIPPFTADPHDLDGLHVGELFLHYSDGIATLWTANESGNIVKISGGEGGVDLSSYLLISEFNKIWEIRTDSQGNEYIFGKLPVVTQYGITMYSGDNVDIPSIAEGLPFDGRTIWFNPKTNQIEVLGGTGGGSGEGVSNFWDLSGIPSWITNAKPTYSYSEIQGTPDLSKYALISQIPSLSGYATEQWVLGRGFALSSDLSKYIPIAGATDITGEKNFTGGLKVNGSPIYYDKDKKYWKLEGDLLVTGGVTMYGDDSDFVPSTIMDAILYDDTTLGINAQGQLYVKGSVGGATTLGSLTNVGSWADSVASQDRIMYQAANSSQWTAKNLSDLAVGGVTGDYLPLSGGTITGGFGALSIKVNNQWGSGVKFENNNKVLGYIGFSSLNEPILYRGASIDVESDYIIHSGNISSYNAGSATRIQAYQHNSGENVLISGSRTDNTFPRYIYDNGWGLCLRWQEGNGVVHNGTIATLNDNVASATKLQTARTIWGQSFDGTGNITGLLSFSTIEGSNPTIKFKNGEFIDAYGNIQMYSTTNTWSVGLNYSPLFCITGTGNVGIGTPNPSDKLHIVGDVNVTKPSTANQASLSFMNTSSDLWQISGRYGSSENGTFKTYYYNGSTWSTIVTLYNNGNMLVSGGITMYSDIRKKTKLKDVVLSLQQVANAPLIEHYYNSDQNKTTHVGSIAQYWAEMNDWFCKKDSEGFYTMEIQNAALASAISVARELVKFESETDRRIRLLEEENKRLKEEVEQLKWNIA